MKFDITELAKMKAAVEGTLTNQSIKDGIQIHFINPNRLSFLETEFKLINPVKFS